MHRELVQSLQNYFPPADYLTEAMAGDVIEMILPNLVQAYLDQDNIIRDWRERYEDKCAELDRIRKVAEQSRQERAELEKRLAALLLRDPDLLLELLPTQAYVVFSAHLRGDKDGVPSKLEAVKLLRHHLDLGLKECKEIVDCIVERYQGKSHA